MPAQSVRKHKKKKTRAQLLAEIAGLPPDAFVPTAHAAAYLGSTSDVMASWRSQRRGPRYYGSREFIRYRISDLDRWMARRADEVPEFEKLEKLVCGSAAA